MSSVAVRTAFTAFMAAEFPAEKTIDLTGHYENIEDLLTGEGIDMETPWIGLQFIGDDEEPVALNANNTEGGYREYGSVYFHVVAPAAIGVGNAIVARAEAIRVKLRGQRLGSILVERVTPPNSESGAAIQFDFGFVGASFIASYYNDVNP